MIKFLPLGGANDIGANSYYLELDGTGILLDCGIHPRRNGIEALPLFDELKDRPLDYVFISHSHQDHIGSLPYLIQKYPYVIIYSTPQTKEIASITLHNTANILAQYESGSTELRIYTHEEIDLLVRSIRDVNYDEEIHITGLRHSTSEIVKIRFVNAGHILGSAGIFITYNEKKIFFSGDINLSDQTIMSGAGLNNIRNLDVLILETTYGSTDSKLLGTWKSEKERFAKAANKILLEGGSVLIPVFALGKTQEILATVADLIKKRKLIDTNIYTGGVSRHISNVYDKNRYKVERLVPDFELNAVNQLNFYDVTDMNEFKKNPGIVLASSGMMIKGTVSYKLLSYWLQMENFAVFGVGYMDEDTPGFKVMNSQPGDNIQLIDSDVPQRILCKVEKFYFSAHSKREDLLKIVNMTKPKRVILIHGDLASHDWLGHNILKNFSHIKLHSAEAVKNITID